MIMVLAVVAALQFAPPPPCHFADQVKQLNLPPGEASNATNINHAVAVLHDGQAVGWLLQTVRGQLFYLDGPIGTNTHRQPVEVATAAIQALGLKPSTYVQRGAVYTVTKTLSLAPLAAKEFELKGCY